MHNKYTTKGQVENVFTGIVTQSSGDKLKIFSKLELTNPTQGMPYGYYAKPVSGDNALVLQTNKGDFVVSGYLKPTTDIAPGEIRLQSSGGAYIHLYNNGTISLNGLIISSGGNIM